LRISKKVKEEAKVKKMGFDESNPYEYYQAFVLFG